MEIKKLIRIKPSKESNFAIIDKSIPQEPGIYFLYNKDLELVYIGQSVNIRHRIVQHVSDKSRREEESFEGYGWHTNLPRGEVEYFSYILIKQKEDRIFKEFILVKILKPKYNK